MKKMIQRLKASCGETLIETLAAILVFTLSSVILLSMSTTAADINRKNQQLAEQNETQLQYAEKGPDYSAPAATATVSFTLVDKTGTTHELSRSTQVNIYRESDDALYSYFKIPEAGE